MRVSSWLIARLPAGTPVCGFRLANPAGAFVELTNWGARWLSVCVPGKDGRMADVLAAPADLLADGFYMGATVGRFANRIGGGRLHIDGKDYELERNDGRNTNHGGFSGFDRKAWDWEVLDDGVRFRLHSPDGEGGFPGNVEATAEYRWNGRNELTLLHRATTDRATYVNLTNHAYFNLGGKGEKITGHLLHIPAHTMLDTTPEFIPTGKRVAVDGTPFDFTHAKPIGRDLQAAHEQLRWNRGYNHCYVLKEEKSATMVEAARLSDPASGRSLTVETDLPAVLLYTAGYYTRPHTAVCLETQYYPDTPSHPDFPSCLLHPGEEYRQTTLFRFGL